LVHWYFGTSNIPKYECTNLPKYPKIKKMKERIIDFIKSKLSPAAILLGAKNAMLSLYEAVLKGGPLAIVGFIASYFFAWWGVAVVMFFYTAFQKEMNVKSAFGIGLTTGILLWSVYAIFLNSANEGFLASKIGSMLTGGVGSGISASQLIQITSVMGGLIAAMGAVTGVYARELVYDTRLKFGWKW
jgi:hypothetical protein